MRVIAGKFKGKRLVFPENKKTRPTSDMVKEAIFAKLFDSVKDAVFLDAFCGSGQIGIEALSRGAKEVVFIENDFNAIKVLKQNIKNLNLENMTRLYTYPVLKVLEKTDKKFDIIFLDPPYDYKEYKQFFEIVSANNLLKNDGIIVCEHSKDLDLNFENYTKTSVKRYGIKSVSYFEIE